MECEASDKESVKETVKHAETSTRVWKLKRYGRFLPKGKAKASWKGTGCAWKIFDSSESSGQLEFSILASAHLLISQGQELLEGFSLLNAQSFLKVQHKSDSLLFSITIKGESRLIRLQFHGRTRGLATRFCEEAVERLQDYVPVEEHMTTRSTDDAAAASTPTEPGPSTQETQAPEDEPRAAPALPIEALSIKQLAQYFLGARELSVPMAYHQSTLPPKDLEALLRLCLLDSDFPAFVEEVEKKLKEIQE